MQTQIPVGLSLTGEESSCILPYDIYKILLVFWCSCYVSSSLFIIKVEAGKNSTSTESLYQLCSSLPDMLVLISKLVDTAYNFLSLCL